MTEEKIREMIKDIVNNNAEYEYTFKDCYGNYVPWKKYKLGEEIHSYCDYRKITKWYVVKCNKEKPFMCIDQDYLDMHYLSNDIVFEADSKEECEAWIKNNTPKEKKSTIKELRATIQELLTTNAMQKIEIERLKKNKVPEVIANKLSAPEVIDNTLSSLDKDMAEGNYDKYVVINGPKGITAVDTKIEMHKVYRIWPRNYYVGVSLVAADSAEEANQIIEDFRKSDPHNEDESFGYHDVSESDLEEDLVSFSKGIILKGIYYF